MLSLRDCPGYWPDTSKDDELCLLCGEHVREHKPSQEIKSVGFVAVPDNDWLEFLGVRA